ncbi:cupin domain-containing protein [Kribbella solani]|uniref:Putative cupin superfamily protein n=1 Tax=Kribbella solani TaxID=236067 RepID=A0A841DSH4_9ACTN|nr:cupin domain-containing protein [Kribbella solani]MBB5980889.1 putative cupin superfamily protein [Kribbella solani]
MTIIFRAADLDSADDYEHALLGQPSAQPLSGDIEVGSYLAFESTDGRIESGSWESAPGRSRWEFADRGEFIQVISGRMTVEEDGGHPATLTAGDSAIFPVGWKGTWTVEEHLRKVFVAFKS